MRSTIDEEGFVMNWSDNKIAATALCVVLATTATVLGFLYLVVGVTPKASVRVITDATPNTGAYYTVPAPPSFNDRVGELHFVSASRVLFTISPAQDGKFTVTVNPEITWDEAGQEFWRLMEKIAAPNTLIWESR